MRASFQGDVLQSLPWRSPGPSVLFLGTDGEDFVLARDQTVVTVVERPRMAPAYVSHHQVKSILIAWLI